MQLRWCPTFFPPFFQINEYSKLPYSRGCSEREAVHNNAQLSFSIRKWKLQSLRSKSGWLGPTVLNSLGHVMGRNSTSNTQYGYFCTMAAIMVSPVADEEYYMHIHFCLGRCTSWYLTQLAGPCPMAGFCPSRSSFSITDICNMLSPKQSQCANTGAKSSKWLQSSCGYTDIIKPTNGKGILVWCPRCLIWWSTCILMAVFSQYFLLK